MPCECRPSIGQRSSFFYRAGAFCEPQVFGDDFRSVALRFPPAFHPLIKHFVLPTYNFGLIRMIAFRLCVNAGSYFSLVCVGVGTHLVIISQNSKAINRPEVCAPVYTTYRPDMFVRKSLSLALAILWSIVCVFCSYVPSPSPCTTPEVRREWRAFSTEEKAEWIRAVKVRIDTLIGRLAKAMFGIQCLSKLPHDPAMTPSVDPSVSLIPPLNTSSSYYDGMTQSFSLAFPGVGSSDYVFIQTLYTSTWI
jgi:hypothetical protein